MNKIVFFNHYHRGDLHISKEFVKEVMKKLPNVEFEYWHNNPEIILKEIGIGSSAQKTPVLCDSKKALLKTSDTLYVNTWVGCMWDIFCKHGGINMYTLYDQWEILYKGINKFFESDLKLNSKKEHYLPRIDFEYLNSKAKTNIDNWIKSNSNKKKVLLCNNTPASGQSFAFDIEKELLEVIESNPNTAFLLTNFTTKRSLKNLFFTSNIINTDQDPDLFEISYLSEQCDVIIGKNSGPYVFCETYNNYMDKDKTFVSFNTKNPQYDSIKETMSNGLKLKCKYKTVPIMNISEKTDDDVNNIINAIKEVV